MGDLSKNFSRSEFGGDVHSSLVERLQLMRDAYGKPIHINSGLRTPAQNKAVGGVEDSEHLTGEGVDILCDNSFDRHILLGLAFQHFGRIGIGKDFIHLGIGRNKTQEVTWLYED